MEGKRSKEDAFKIKASRSALNWWQIRKIHKGYKPKLQKRPQKEVTLN